MFTIDFNPVIAELGPFQLRWYSLFYIVGFAALYFLFIYASKKRLIKMSRETIESFLSYSVFGILIGARLFYFLFYHISALIKTPFEIFMIWHGGMSFHGGLIGFLIAAFIFSRRYKVDIWRILDISAINAIFALMLGRIGNLMNGELLGTPFNGPWCAVFVKYDSVCRHPYPIYAFISHFILLSYLLFLVYLNRKTLTEFIGKGVIAAHFLIGYGILRIITDIWKVDNVVFGIKTGQWLSLATIAFGFFLIYLKNQQKKMSIRRRT